MRNEIAYKYLSNGSHWTRELLFVFLSGFLLASLLWLGLWTAQGRSADAAAAHQPSSPCASQAGQ